MDRGNGSPSGLSARSAGKACEITRLCFADKASADPYPYDPRFLRDFEEKQVYGRFRDSGLLYLASGYAFVAYGARQRYRDEHGKWRSFFEDTIATHMRRHYFQMGLLAHFELASLLAFSSRISRAVELHDSEELFERRMHEIEDEFLQFLHRFRFTALSSHLPARELFDLWRRHLRLKEVFEDLRQEIASATQYLFNRAASRSARMAERLSAIAALGLILGLTFSFLGMNVLFGDKTLEHLLGNGYEKRVWFQMGIVLAVLAGFAWVGLAGLRRLRVLAEPLPRPRRKPSNSFSRRLESWLLYAAWTVTGTAVVLSFVGWLLH